MIDNAQTEVAAVRMTRCDHKRHVGTCPECQRTQLARWRAQLIEASNGAHASGAQSRPSHIAWDPGKPVVSKRSATLTCA